MTTPLLDVWPAFFDDPTRACNGEDPEIFFPDEGNHTVYLAKRICGRCKFSIECGQWAMERPEPFGVWGGLTQNDRRRLRRDGAA